MAAGGIVQLGAADRLNQRGNFRSREAIGPLF